MPKLDAVIVPTSRTSGHLQYATQLADKTNACLVALCSGQAAAKEVQGVGVDIPASYNHQLIVGLATDTHPQALFGREHNDISLKRNLGMLLARLVGWKTILFLDDDLTSITGLEQALGQVQDVGAAGFLVSEFPDNSVVRHAERLSGVEPGVALSGGALVVNVPSALGFFPRVYNEDWFFLHDMLGRPTHRVTGKAQQQPYNPFQDPLRAASEEFGDVLAEGIRALSSLGVNCTDATVSDWQDVLDCRQKLVQGIRSRLSARYTEPDVRDAISALQAADARLVTFTSLHCVEYIAAWREDINLWQRRLAVLPTGLSLDQALRYLALSAQPAMLAV